MFFPLPERFRVQCFVGPMTFLQNYSAQPEYELILADHFGMWRSW